MKDNRTVNCSFAVMSETGEQPKAQILMAGFEREGGMAVAAQVKGDTGDIGLMIADLVENHAKTVRERHGVNVAAAFVNLVGVSMSRGAGDKAMEAANRMLDMLNPEIVMGMLGDCLKKRFEEEDEE